MNPKFCFMLNGVFCTTLCGLSEDQLESVVLRAVMGVSCLTVGTVPADGSYVLAFSEHVAAGDVGPAIF